MSPTLRVRHLFALLLLMSMIAAPLAQVQSASPEGSAQTAPSAMLPQGRLDALLAPIALYPDELLAQILMASTYPLEVVTAARFVHENPTLTGAELDQALAERNWDPSVLSLTAFPQVLQMMNDKLDWMQQLGDAFLANADQLMDTVQNLRYRAAAAGTLQGSPQQTVLVQDGDMVIEPTEPDDVYVPSFDPSVAYGPWSDPGFMPWYWLPPPIYGYPDYPAAGIVFGTVVVVTPNHWGWAHPRWHRHSIDIANNGNVFLTRPQYHDAWPSGQWQHLPEHRHGVAYRDSATRDRYAHTSNAAIETRQPYRGRDIAPRPQEAVSTMTPVQRPPGRQVPQPQTSYGRSVPVPQPSMPRSMTVPPQRAPTFTQRPVPPPAYNPQPRAQVQVDSSRGQASRQSTETRTSPQGTHR